MSKTTRTDLLFGRELSPEDEEFRGKVDHALKRLHSYARTEQLIAFLKDHGVVVTHVPRPTDGALLIFSCDFDADGVDRVQDMLERSCPSVPILVTNFRLETHYMDAASLENLESALNRLIRERGGER